MMRGPGVESNIDGSDIGVANIFDEWPNRTPIMPGVESDIGGTDIGAANIIDEGLNPETEAHESLVDQTPTGPYEASPNYAVDAEGVRQGKRAKKTPQLFGLFKGVRQFEFGSLACPNLSLAALRLGAGNTRFACKRGRVPWYVFGGQNGLSMWSGCSGNDGGDAFVTLWWQDLVRFVGGVYLALREQPCSSLPK
ncbi:Hypothetical predicted protein [Olea europaea subsp. europaea]|uniref:Uncharacterized protein n=1 Tax=Olea europaea subsp. europaea TaxID=158383 RepID=A0A8S0QRQ6_OLEEU|nr:Hypothetical predicted protein [Olea europaea subsp. europaea]